MDFSAALGALDVALKFGITPSLEGIRALTDALGRPQDAFASIQVTGTNGKSSVTRLVAALLRAEGSVAGAYTSPHLESYTERIELAGAPVCEDDFARAMTAAIGASERIADTPTFTEFELLTAAALWLFRERRVDFASLEVGMGGRWDSTSVVGPAVAVVTGVGLDHTERLGSTVGEIAADKSSIIRPGASVVLGPGTRDTAGVFLERAAAFGLHPRFVTAEGEPTIVPEALTVRFSVRHAPSSPGGDLALEVRGVHATYDGLTVAAPSYQAPNIAVAIAAAECALGRGLDVERVRAALRAMRFPGRFEFIASDPPIVLDGAHNPQAAEVLAQAIVEAWPDARHRPMCVLGVLRDKDADGIVRALAPVVDGFVVTQPDNARARDACALAAVVESVTGETPEVVPDSDDAVVFARVRSAGAGVVVAGSLYLVGEVRAPYSSRGCP